MQKNIKLSWLLNLLNINFKTYKSWVNNGSKDYKTKRNTSYDLFIKLVFNDCDLKYGTHHKWGHKKIALKFGIGRKTVLSSMKSQGLFPDNCEKSRKWKSYVSGKKEPVNTAPNLLKNPISGKVEFFASRPLEKICLDISEFKFNNSKLYMFAYIDVYSRLPLKTYFSSNQTTKELIKSLYILKNNYNICNSIIHTDRGAQFRSISMMDFCKANKIQQSMTDGYASWQNVIVETFFNIIKQNYFKGYKFLNKTEFLYWMKNCIWNYSNNRIINKLKITPIEMYKSNLLK